MSYCEMMEKWDDLVEVVSSGLDTYLKRCNDDECNHHFDWLERMAAGETMESIVARATSLMRDEISSLGGSIPRKPTTDFEWYEDGVLITVSGMLPNVPDRP